MPYDLQNSLRPTDERAALELDTARAIVAVSRQWRARFAERLRVAHHTETTYSALVCLADAPSGLKQSEPAAKIGITSGALVRQLDVLEARGLIVRSTIVGDRRAHLLLLTPAGRDATRELVGLAQAFRATLFAHMDGASLTGLCRSLSAFSASA
ncbi:MarR family winged helix-turn-helix transcriptional regulator [Brevundimonas sp. VNH65]|uniref:MarR family winged helix-turn-helix transcriptional regulator n=1 Tax=Brevundimonas sp. VNH65 TaxID=3400917 RepID=UPI003C055002